MTPRERFWRTMRFESTDRIPFWADWIGPFERWRAEGMPEDVEPFEFFGFEGLVSAFWGDPRVPVSLGLCPGFQKETLEETDTYRICRGSDGVVSKILKDVTGLPTIQFLRFPITNRRDWERLRDEHLDPENPDRYPDEAEWEKLKERWRQRDYPISIDGGSFYGFVRNWFGVENLSVMFYDDPDLIHEIMDYLTEFFIRVLRRALEEVEIDFALFWEDMCYKTGPLISPAMFREFLLPCYKKVTSFLVQHGVELSWVDCDGNIEALIPLWIEGGVRGFYPLEVAAGMDAASLRRQYGRQIVMWGNVDKREIAKGRRAIDAEMRRLAPVVAEGGFVPLIDHCVPEDVSYKDFVYYLQRRKDISDCG